MLIGVLAKAMGEVRTKAQNKIGMDSRGQEFVIKYIKTGSAVYVNELD